MLRRLSLSARSRGSRPGLAQYKQDKMEASQEEGKTEENGIYIVIENTVKTPKEKKTLQTTQKANVKEVLLSQF